MAIAAEGDVTKPVAARGLEEAVRSAMDHFGDLLGREISSVIGAAPAGGGWLVTMELVERRAIPNSQDLLGVYEVQVDGGGVTRYERTRVRRRGDVG